MNSFPSPSVAFSSLLPSPRKGKLAPQRRMSSFPLPSVAFSSLLPSPRKGKLAPQRRMRLPSPSVAFSSLLLPHSEKKKGLRLQPLREALFGGVDPSIRYNDRVDQRRGEIPSFVVSRMGSRGREIEIPSPGVLSLFVHFLFARAKRKWTPSQVLASYFEEKLLPVLCAKAKKKRGPRPASHFFSTVRIASRMFFTAISSSPSGRLISPRTCAGITQRRKPSRAISLSR